MSKNENNDVDLISRERNAKLDGHNSAPTGYKCYRSEDLDPFLRE